MLSISQLKSVYSQIKEKSESTNLSKISNWSNSFETIEEVSSTFSEWMASKFSESSEIFSKLDSVGVNKFCHHSTFTTLEENQSVFKKGQECNQLFFLLYGDINLYEEETCGKLLKTISAGTIYGHKIKSSFNYFALTKNLVNMLTIPKKAFDEIIEECNTRKAEFKKIFLKKFFPKLRVYSDDLIKSLLGYFIREVYEKDSKILIDGEYDEYIYLIVKGRVSLTKSTRRIKNFNLDIKRWAVLETLTKGDVFGVYSALKHNKNNYTARVTSDRVEVYKISKAHCLFYFGGSGGVIPEALKGIDSVQQMSIHNKLDYLENTTPELIKFNFLTYDAHDLPKKKLIDESEIPNGLKDAWKQLENLGSKISEFKNNLLKNNLTKTSLDVFAKPENEVKDHTKIMGFATNRVVSKGMNKGGLSATQMKGMNKLQSICGVKKPEEKKEDLSLAKIEKDNSSNNINSESSLNANSANSTIERLAMKSDESKRNKLTADLTSEIQVETKSVNSLSSVSTSSTNEVNISSSDNNTKNPSNPPVAKPVKKGFSLRNLI